MLLKRKKGKRKKRRKAAAASKWLHDPTFGSLIHLLKTLAVTQYELMGRWLQVALWLGWNEEQEARSIFEGISQLLLLSFFPSPSVHPSAYLWIRERFCEESWQPGEKGEKGAGCRQLSGDHSPGKRQCEDSMLGSNQSQGCEQPTQAPEQAKLPRSTPDS